MDNKQLTETVADILKRLIALEERVKKIEKPARSKE
jgi:hypothetical protein